jgi:hypothetical protein
MADDPDSLSFRVSAQNLTAAIELLGALGGLDLYPEAYQVLVSSEIVVKCSRHRAKFCCRAKPSRRCPTTSSSS